MTAADRLRLLMVADPRPDRIKAEAAGLRPAYWSNLKLGRKNDPELSTAAKILAALGRCWADLDPIDPEPEALHGATPPGPADSTPPAKEPKS